MTGTLLRLALVAVLSAAAGEATRQATTGGEAATVPQGTVQYEGMEGGSVPGFSSSPVAGPVAEATVPPSPSPTPEPEPTIAQSVMQARQEVATTIVRGDLYSVVARWFPEHPAYAWSVLMCESGGNPSGALLWLTATGGAGELTPWQIMPGNFRAMGEWPIPGDFEQQTRLARKWFDRIGGWFGAIGGWSCA